MSSGSKRFDVVVVGGSAAAHAAVEALDENVRTRTSLLWVRGIEDEETISRPALSKEYLQQRINREQLNLPTTRPCVNVDLLELYAVATGLDTECRLIHVDGESYGFDQLLIATGMSPRKPLNLGDGVTDRVRSLRTLADVDWVLEKVSSPGSPLHITIVGGGLIGNEVASSLASRGVDATLVHLGTELLTGTFPPKISERILKRHAEEGVEVLLDTAVARVDLSPSKTRLRISLAGGRSFESDLVINASGSVPATEWIRKSPSVLDPDSSDVRDDFLTSDGFIQTDDCLRTAIPGVWSGGDVAKSWSPRRGTYLGTPHWSSALAQGRLAGANIAAVINGEEPSASSDIPYFWSDIYNLKVQQLGQSTMKTKWVPVIDEQGEIECFEGYENSILSAVVGINKPRAVFSYRNRFKEKS